MRAVEFITENKTTLNKLYGGNFPDRDESFWDEVRPHEFDNELEIKVLPKHKLAIMLQGQYRVEHLDEILDMMDPDQQEILQRYMNDPNLSNKIILLSGDRIIDGNHRALAAAMRGVSIKYVDLADLDEQDVTEAFDKEAGAWRDWQLKMLPRKIEMLSRLVKGWVPSEEDHIAAIEAGYDAMKETGDVKDAAKAIDNKFKEIQRQQGVAEGFDSDKEYQGIIMSMLEGEDGFKLVAKSPDGKKLGFVEFSYDTDGTIRAEELEVYEKYRGQGIAKTMYDYVKNLGFKIARSDEQTPDGARFWDKNRPGKRIWEQGVAEDTANLPSVLYHATYKPRLKSIKLKGLGAGGKRNWEDSKRGIVYLSLDPNVAESYAETSDMVPEEWLDEIVILKISTAGLDPNKFHIDSNVQDNAGDTVEYHGVIPVSNISLYKRDNVDEMALSTYKTMGDFTKQGPFTGADKRLVPHPKNIEKATRFFEQTPFDFRLFFSNIPGTGKYSEYGPMAPDELKKVFGQDAEEIINGSQNAITVVYVGNKGDRKVMLTPWMMAHRFGHAVNRGAYKAGYAGAWKEAEKHFFTTINNLLNEYYGKVDRFPDSGYGRPKSERMNFNLTPEYNALFNAIGTQRSSRSGEIRRPYEFFYELFAQYLGTGQITLNPFPTNLTYGRKAWGNPTRFMNIKPEYRDETERKYAAEVLARDMEILFNDVLSDSVGKIFVM